MTGDEYLRHPDQIHLIRNTTFLENFIGSTILQRNILRYGYNENKIIVNNKGCIKKCHFPILDFILYHWDIGNN